ncbi:MAG TPA: D-arabinono-1,4-lactone oxidase, partial [Nocardioidaceae bacterium]|nr:D-arabinono-1,4-lactone oxidase [Nocardioidaceae bacterium]
LELDRLARLVDVDAATGLVTVEAGMPLHRLNILLAEHGLAMPNLGDIDRQTVAGAISTGTHGTGARLPSLAAQAVGLEMVSGSGEIVTYGADDGDLLDAARVSLGSLGVITRVTLQTVPAFALHAVEAPASLEAVLEALPDLVEGHDHFEFYWFPHTARALTKQNDRVDEPAALRPLPRWRFLLDDEVLSNGVFEGVNRIAATMPRAVRGLNALSARAISRREYVDASYRVFVSPRRVRFNESEYAVERDAVPHVIGELRRWVDQHDVAVPFPVEVRFAAADGGWLSTAYGRESGYVAVHQYHRMARDRYFAAFEAIVRDAGGRPHWGKLHSLGSDRLRRLYPRFDEFAALRDRMDPDRRFANPYLERVLGR